MPDAWPTVSVVVVNFNGKEYLETCLESLRNQDYAADQIEVILIDNASSDGSVAFVRERFPEVRVVVNDSNTGFSPAVNQGAKLAGSQYLALINNDAEADPAWLREAVTVLDVNDRVACVGSKILREDRSTLDYAGGQMAFYGHGYARNVEQPDEREIVSKATLFASGGAMVVRRRLFLEVGGFDDSFFAFFEDVDFGWRLWVLGYEVRYAPKSRVYHRHHGTIERFGYARERYLLERNALATIFKNYEDETLARALPATIVLALSRGLADMELGLPDFHIGEDTTPIGDITISDLTGAHLAAIRDFALDLDRLRAKRKAIQDRRVTDDRVIARLFEQALRPNVDGEEFLQTFRNVVEAFDLEEVFRPGNKVMIITLDKLSKKMAGPAIRAWEMAKLLSREHEVVLCSTEPVEITHSEFDVYRVHEGLLNGMISDIDVIIFQGFAMHEFPSIKHSQAAVLVDIYDPFHLEALELRKLAPSVERFLTAKSDVAVLNEQLDRGDFFVCASEKQRDFWLGQLAGIGRINPSTYDQDESLRALLGIAPFGLPSEPPVKRRQVIKGVVPGIAEEDFVLMWGGGIYNWFDPLTLIKAVAEVADELPDVKLFFLGNAHPNPNVPKMRMSSAAYNLAEDLGVLGTQVFFNEGWVEYEQRADYLLEADLGVSTHYEHIETAFSFRTRILDYLWTGLPILATEGDSLSQMVKEHGLGLTVPPEDVEALVSAIKRLRKDGDLYKTCKTNVEVLAPDMTWEKALAPIVDFCRQPRRAPDQVGLPLHYVKTANIVLKKSPLYLAQRFAAYYRTAGRETAVIHARNFVRKRLRRG